MLYRIYVLITLIFSIFIPLMSSANTNTNQTTLPLAFSPQGFPAAVIEIQGKKIPLAFDTASVRTNIALSEKIIKEQHLKLFPSDVQMCFHNSAGETCLKSFIIPNLTIGNFSLQNIPGVMRDYMWGEKQDPRFIIIDAYRNGVIGLDLLRQFNVLIDYPHHQAILMKRDLYPENYNVKNWLKIPFELNKYGINTLANINGIETSLSWFTASNHSVIRSSTAKKIGHIVLSQYGSFEPNKFIIGNIEMPKTEFYITDEPFPFEIISSNFFQKHVVFIDFKNQYLFVQNKGVKY